LRWHDFQSFQVLVAEHLKGRAMFEFILAATARSYFFLRRFMPTAVVIDAINTRRGLKWGVPRCCSQFRMRLQLSIADRRSTPVGQVG
jgi:hypothetical protein